MRPEVALVETASRPAIESVGLSHLSLEVGHLYFEEFRRGHDFLAGRFGAVAPWIDAAKRAVPAKGGRISTCYLIDDYFTPHDPPAEVIPLVLEAASAAGVSIDYLARESACAVQHGVGIAQLVVDWLVAEPPKGTNGLRPPPTVTGWLTNGERSPSGNSSREAMKDVAKPRWEPPVENARNNHSIFIDVEMWSEGSDGRLWSCPMLAAVWQLARLGLLRYEGRAVLQPEPSPGVWPREWSALPAVIQLRENAQPFSAYHTLSLLDARFLPIEHAVRTILSQVAIDQEIMEQIGKRAAGEQILLSHGLLDRIRYVFGL